MIISNRMYVVSGGVGDRDLVDVGSSANQLSHSPFLFAYLAAIRLGVSYAYLRRCQSAYGPIRTARIWSSHTASRRPVANGVPLEKSLVVFMAGCRLPHASVAAMSNTMMAPLISSSSKR